jgi:amino acid transporter
MGQGSTFISLTVVGLVILYVLSALILLSFRDRKDTYRAATIATVIAYAIGVFWGGYMLGTPNNPMYLGMLVGWLLPFLVVLGVNLFRVHRKLARKKEPQ